MRTMIYNGPWYDGEARFIVVLVNRLKRKKQQFHFLGYYNYPEETEVQRVKYVEDEIDYYIGFD